MEIESSKTRGVAHKMYIFEVHLANTQATASDGLKFYSSKREKAVSIFEDTILS